MQQGLPGLDGVEGREWEGEGAERTSSPSAGPLAGLRRMHPKGAASMQVRVGAGGCLSEGGGQAGFEARHAVSIAGDSAARRQAGACQAMTEAAIQIIRNAQQAHSRELEEPNGSRERPVSGPHPRSQQRVPSRAAGSSATASPTHSGAHVHGGVHVAAAGAGKPDPMAQLCVVGGQDFEEDGEGSESEEDEGLLLPSSQRYDMASFSDSSVGFMNQHQHAPVCPLVSKLGMAMCHGNSMPRRHVGAGDGAGVGVCPG